MKKCPLCHRTYPDDLNFCLECGRVLQAYGNNEATVVDDETTLVYPQPVPPGPTPPDPVPPLPVPQPPSRRTGWIVAGVIGVIVVALLGGGVIIAIWSANQTSQASETAASPSPSYVYSASPGGSPVPLCEVLNNCPSPTPADTSLSSPSPWSNESSSPSPTISEPVENTVTTGTYQSELTIESDGRSTLLKLKLTLNTDGTYLQQAYVTFHGTGISDLLGIEERGRVSQSNEQLILKDRMERKLDFETGEWSTWSTPSGGSSIRQQVRNVTPTTFQIYDNDERKWYTFSKP